MITCGYWCDECRVKYIRYTCKEGLPCGHDKDRAIYVECQHFSTSGEAVYMEIGTWKLRLWLYPINRRCSSMLWDWAVKINRAEKGIFVGEWLPNQADEIIRAFDNRWDSHKEPPEWVRYGQINAAEIVARIKEIRGEESIEEKLSESKLVETLPIGAGGYRGLQRADFAIEAITELNDFLDAFEEQVKSDDQLIDFRIEIDIAEPGRTQLSTFTLTCIPSRQGEPRAREEQENAL